MPDYRSFNKEKNKIRKNWENSKSNQNNLIPNIKLDFNSINFNKKVFRLTLLKDEEFLDTGGPIICWIAKEIYGSWKDLRVNCVRYYFLEIAPKWFLNFYIYYGEAIAEFISNKTILKNMLRPVFNYFSSRGFKHAIQSATE